MSFLYSTDETSKIDVLSQATNGNIDEIVTSETCDNLALNANNNSCNDLSIVCNNKEEDKTLQIDNNGKRKAEEDCTGHEIYTHDDFPNELKILIQPYHCQLCDIKMNSVNSSELHYECKRHIRKTNFWLKEWSKKTGEPIRKRLKIDKSIDANSGINHFHCDYCNLVLTSIQHAKEHYAGKKHRRRVYGPSRKIIQQNNYDRVIFQQIELPIVTDNNEIAPVEDAKTQTYCKICNITVTSSAQMQVHLEGNKHGKKLKTLGAPPYAKPGDSILSCYEKLYDNTNQPSKYNIRNDVSIFRTPSGNYYCKHCNLTLESVHIFSQHLKSKNHLKKINPME